MARRGSFGRSGATQNLSLLVYSLLKDQMATDAQSILTAYETNMSSGRYSAQFNGQNVDGNFVMNYYRDMLDGFPPGSTEYETISSRLAAFQQRYENDIQNLVVNSMNNGTQIDFGLLGEGFQNKGIGDVNLTDMESWATSRIAALEENGQMTEADALKGTLFAARFNVAKDGKEAAYYRGELTAGQMSAWLNGQLKGSLAQGMTKDSKAYRDIAILAGQYAKTAKTEDQNKQFEKYQEDVYAFLDPLEQVARQVLDNYMGSDGQFKEKITALGAEADGDFPAFTVLQKLAQGSQDGTLDGVLKDVMAVSDQGTGVSLQDLFSQATLDASRGLSDLANGNLSGVSPAQKRTLSAFMWKNKDMLTNFVTLAGSNIDGGAAVTTDQLTADLGAAGMVQKFDPQTGRNLMIGGQPDLVYEAFKNLKASAGSTAQTAWLNELAEGFIPSSVIDAKRFGGEDGKVSFDELSQAIVDGTISSEQWQGIQDQVAQSAQNLYMPNKSTGGGVDGVSVVNAALNAVYNQSRISMGDVMVVRPNGMVEVTDNPFKGGGATQAVPYYTMYKGKVVTAYAQPAKMVMDAEGAEGAEWPASGFKVAIYKTPGNTENSDEFGNGNYMVTIKGKFKMEDGSTLDQTRQVPLRVWTEYLEKSGVPTDGLADLGNGTFGMKITEGMDPEERVRNGQFIEDMWLKSNTNSVWSVPDAANLDEYSTYHTGSLSTGATQRKIIADAFADPKGIMEEAKAIAQAAGRDNISGVDLSAAVLAKFPPLYQGSNTTLLKNTLSTSKPFMDAFNAAFPQYKMDSGGGFGLLPTGIDPVGFIDNMWANVGKSINAKPRNGPTVWDVITGKDKPKPTESTTPSPQTTPGVSPTSFTNNAFRNFGSTGPTSVATSTTIKPPKINTSPGYVNPSNVKINTTIKQRGR